MAVKGRVWYMTYIKNHTVTKMRVMHVGYQLCYVHVCYSGYAKISTASAGVQQTILQQEVEGREGDTPYKDKFQYGHHSSKGSTGMAGFVYTMVTRKQHNAQCKG